MYLTGYKFLSLDHHQTIFTLNSKQVTFSAHYFHVVWDPIKLPRVLKIYLKRGFNRILTFWWLWWWSNDRNLSPIS